MLRIVTEIYDRLEEGYRLTDGTELFLQSGGWLDCKGRKYTSVAISSTDGGRSIIGFVRRDTLDKADKEIMSVNPEGAAYVRYNELIGGERIGLSMPVGYPYEIQEYLEGGGTLEGIYEGCVRAGITWYEMFSLYPVDRRVVSDPDVEYERIVW